LCSAKLERAFSPKKQEIKQADAQFTYFIGPRNKGFPFPISFNVLSKIVNYFSITK
jgi:hypothetical protein